MLLGLIGPRGLQSLSSSSTHASSMREGFGAFCCSEVVRREGRLRGISGISAPPPSSMSMPCCWLLLG